MTSSIFIDELKQNKVKFGAICLQETWLADDEKYSLFNLPGYNCIFQGKRCSERGGLVIYLLNNIYNHTLVPISNNFEKWEAQFLKISGFSARKKILIGNVYRLPGETNNDYDIFIKEFICLLNSFEHSNCNNLVAGDFNINLLDIVKRCVAGDFFNAVTSHGFLPLITLPTRLTDTKGTLIDNIFCKLSSNTVQCTSGILTDRFSDHQPYFSSINLHPLQKKKIKLLLSKNRPKNP